MNYIPAYKKILFVSPTESLRIFALQTVSHHNQVVIVSSLEEAQVVLGSYKPDVIVLDQSLLQTWLSHKDLLGNDATIAIVTGSDCVRGYLMSLEPLPKAP